jgi:hypothetical protein
LATPLAKHVLILVARPTTILSLLTPMVYTKCPLTSVIVQQLKATCSSSFEYHGFLRQYQIPEPLQCSIFSSSITYSRSSQSIYVQVLSHAQADVQQHWPSSPQGKFIFSSTLEVTPASLQAWYKSFCEWYVSGTTWRCLSARGKVMTPVV